MAASSFLNPVLGPLLSLDPLLAITILSFLVALVSTLATKYLTDQKEMKRLKEEMESSKKKMRELRDRPEEAMKVQKESMKTSFAYMRISLKASLITAIPLLFVFWWMSGHFAFESIKPNEEFTLSLVFSEPVIGEATIGLPAGIRSDGSLTKEISSDNVMWALKGDSGSHFVDVTYDGKTHAKEVLITDGREYIEPSKKINEGDLESININYKKKIILNLFGWQMGWLITYILLSVAFSLGLRKALKVY